MPDLGTTYTFLYTDIEGSTKQWEEHAGAMRAALERHDALLRQAIHAEGGQVFRTAGDAFCASFSSAPAAVRAAVQAQRALFAENWPLKNPLRVRMALHTGLVEAHAGDFVGASLNHIGRLLSVCYGGQTLLTLVTQELVRDQLPEGVSLLDLGQHRFRDLIHPEHIYQLVIDGLPDEFPPLKSLELYPNNLDVPLSSFIGRKREIAEVLALLGGSRLVTLTGPGGTGKTRLSLQAAAEGLEAFQDGAWFIELAPLSDPAHIVQTIAMALGIREQPGRPLKTVLIEGLRERKLLVILDNCEHLVEACAPLVEELLRASPGLKFLTSSREMLGVMGEQIYRVPPLSLPNPAEDSFEDLDQSEAVRLFAVRAAAVQPHFRFNRENSQAIAQICRRLDGIPLAIELAAARSTLFTPAQIAARLDDRFRLLTGGSRTAIPRQQTLEALFDWSYDLLSGEEQVLFRRLSVFSGGWTIEAAEAIDADAGSAEPGRPDAVELLSRLVNKSLVIADQAGLEARYRMLETTRQYAQKKLLESGEAAAIRSRHMAYFAGHIQELWKAMQSVGSMWVVAIDGEVKVEMDNLRAAQKWAMENDLSTALLLIGNLSYFWGRYGFAGEMRSTIHDGLTRAGETPEFQSDLDRPHAGLLAGAWVGDALLSLLTGQNAEGLNAAQTAISLARLAQDNERLAMALSMSAEAAGMMGNRELAIASSQEAIATAHLTGQKWLLGMVLFNGAAYALFPLGEFERAKIYIDEGIQIIKSLNDRVSAVAAQVFMGLIAIYRGEAETARESFLGALETLQTIGDPYYTNVARSGLADAHRLLGNYGQASVAYLETIRGWRKLGNMGAIARCLECLGFVALSLAQGFEREKRESRAGLAATLFGGAEKIREENQAEMLAIERVQYEQQIAVLKNLASQGENDPTRLDKNWALGREMNLDQRIEYINMKLMDKTLDNASTRETSETQPSQPK